MSFEYSFRQLFQCNLIHEYYLNIGAQSFTSMTPDEQAGQMEKYNYSDFAEILPTHHCITVLRNHRLLPKIKNDGLLIVTMSDPSDDTKSFHNLAEMKLSFMVRLKNHYFHNLTSIPLGENLNSIYYFSNLAASAGAAFPSLSLPYPDYVSGESYEMGTLILFNGNAYEATESMPASSIDPDQPGSGWQVITDENYVNSSDRISVRTSFIEYELPSVGLNVTIIITDVNGSTVHTSAASSTDGTVNKKAVIDMLPEGRYTLQITNDADSSVLITREFYLLKEKGISNLFGIIEIFGDTSLGTYSLTDSNRNLNNPEFVIRFRNRSTIWRFIDNADRSVILESGPNPLTNKGFISILHNGQELVNPSVNLVKPETDKVVSEIFITQ